MRVHQWNFVFLEKQCPPPLVVSLELHDVINKPKLVGNIVIVHLEVVVIAQIPMEKRSSQPTSSDCYSTLSLWPVSTTRSHSCERSCKKVFDLSMMLQSNQTTDCHPSTRLPSRYPLPDLQPSPSSPPALRKEDNLIHSSAKLRGRGLGWEANMQLVQVWPS